MHRLNDLRWYISDIDSRLLFHLFLIYISELRLTLCTSTCFSPLGVTSGDVFDWQISASSSYPASWDDGCHIKNARLSFPNGQAWCAGRKDAGEWILVDLGVPAKVTGVTTQGKCDGEEWVSKYQISYSLDAYKWYFVRDVYNNKKVFHGNVDSHNLKTNLIEPSAQARFFRLHVIAWYGHPSLRLEILGCQDCKTHISEHSGVKISASSSATWRKKKSCQPYDAALSLQKAWCARKNNANNQWLQFDLGPPHLVTGVITKGRGDSRKKHWVKAYSMTYSNDSKVWFTYKDGNHLDPKIFGGNMDKFTERRHYLNFPFTARFVRIKPHKWHKAIAMRAALMGCPHVGACGPSFFRIMEESPCVENLAWKRKTWVNDERHHWPEWTHGQAAQAVDGLQDSILNQCTVVQNFNAEEPIWMVDLGSTRQVSGVLLVTWQGQGEGQDTFYHDYIFGLDKMTVFVEKRPRLDRLDGDSRRECATVTRLNNAIFRERLHLECSHLIKGRYLYIKGSGVANRWNRLFSIILCEVMVY